MPILPAEPDLYPDDFWDSLSTAEGSPFWHCLHTKPRQEKATARHLFARRISYYLPQVARESRTPRGRRIRSIIPLFPSYVFMRGDEYQRLDAFQGGTLVNVLEVSDQATLTADLRQIHHMLKAGLAVSFEPTYPVGGRVRITGGPLMGLVGTVVRRGPHDRFVAVVEFLGAGAVVDLEDWQVERIAPKASRED